MPITNLLTVTEAFQRVRVDILDLVDAKSPEERATFKETINALSSADVKAAAEYQTQIVNEAGQKVFDVFLAARKAYRAHLDEIIRLLGIGGIDKAMALMQGATEQSVSAESPKGPKDTATRARKAFTRVERDSGPPRHILHSPASI